MRRAYTDTRLSCVLYGFLFVAAAAAFAFLSGASFARGAGLDAIVLAAWSAFSACLLMLLLHVIWQRTRNPDARSSHWFEAAFAIGPYAIAVGMVTAPGTSGSLQGPLFTAGGAAYVVVSYLVALFVIKRKRERHGESVQGVAT